MVDDLEDNILIIMELQQCDFLLPDVQGDSVDMVILDRHDGLQRTHPGKVLTFFTKQI